MSEQLSIQVKFFNTKGSNVWSLNNI